MFDQETIEFASDDELREPIPEKTVARIQVRPSKDGELGAFPSGESKFGPWVMVPFEVVEGDHRGEWASMMLSVKGTDRRFRAVVKLVTGLDLTQGGVTLSFADFRERLVSGVFEAELGPERRKGEETGFNAVTRLIARVGDRPRPAQADSLPVQSTSVAPSDGSDDDIPF